MEAQELPQKLSEEDERWLAGANLPEVLHPVARRHGRQLFQLVMHCGACNHAVGVLSRQGQGNRAIGQALFVLSGALNTLATELVVSYGKEMKDFTECKMDIERMAALMDTGKALPEGAKVSKGGIILNS